MEKLSFSLKLFSGHFYGQSFIKTVRGPLEYMYILLILQRLTNFLKPFLIAGNLLNYLFEMMLYNPVNNISDMLERSLGLTSSKQRILFCLF